MIELFTRLVVAFESIAKSLASQPTDAAAPAKPARTTKAADPKPEVVKAAAPDTTVVKADPPAEPAFAYDTLKASVVKLANMGAAGKNAALAILAEYDVTKADKIPEDQWPVANDKFIAAAAELANPTQAEGDFA